MATNPYESPVNRSTLPKPPSDWLGSALRMVVLLGLLGFLLLMFMPRHFLSRGAREPDRRASCANNLHNIALALHNYESEYHSLPPAYTVDADGKPLHSWRTLILPHIEQQSLYSKIDLSKPWDDPANKTAYDTSLALYRCASSSVERDMTTYFAVVSPDGCFQPTRSVPFAAIKDRRELTLLLLEVSEKNAVHWMSPHDATEEMILNREADGELAHPSGSQAAFADGHVKFLANDVRPEVLRAMISIDGHDNDVARDH